MTEVSIEDVENALREHPDPVITVSDLHDELDCSDRHILNLLRGLEHIGRVHSKQAGARAVVWWHTDLRHPSQSEEPESERDERPTNLEPEPTREPAERDEEEIATTDEIAQAIDAAAANWDDSAERIDARTAAVRAVLSALRERSLSKSEIIAEFYAEYPVDGQSEETWWRKNIAEGNPAPLKQLAEYNPGTQKWEM